jgi:hypothetical protein
VREQPKRSFARQFPAVSAALTFSYFSVSGQNFISQARSEKMSTSSWGRSVMIGLLVTALSVAGIAWAVYRSKHESAEMKEIVGSLDDV